MSNIEKIYDEIKEVNQKVTEIQIKQAEHKKDIEYIKKELEIRKADKKENKKILVAIGTSIGAIFMSALKWIVG